MTTARLATWIIACVVVAAIVIPVMWLGPLPSLLALTMIVVACDCLT